MRHGVSVSAFVSASRAAACTARHGAGSHQDGVQLRADGRVLVKLKRVWRDATSHLLRADRVHGETHGHIPRPAVNLVLYHGVLAPHARWRSHVVRYGRPAPDVNAREREARPRAAGTPGAWTWVALMRRVFDLDVLACPRCGGRLRIIAAVQDPLAVQAILTRLARSGAPAPPGPAPPAPAALP